MSSTLKDQIKADMIAAMRAKEKETLGVIRMLQAAIKQKEIDDKVTLEDAGVLAVVEKMIKQRRESIKQYEAGNRPELAAKENQEITVLEVYLPTPLSAEELNALIEQTIQQTGASSIKDMGKVMGLLKGQIQGRANMSDVSNIIKERLS